MPSVRFGDRDLRSLLKRTASRIQAEFPRAKAAAVGAVKRIGFCSRFEAVTMFQR
jgi:hypothetical protein